VDTDISISLVEINASVSYTVLQKMTPHAMGINDLDWSNSVTNFSWAASASLGGSSQESGLAVPLPPVESLADDPNASLAAEEVPSAPTSTSPVDGLEPALRQRRRQQLRFVAVAAKDGLISVFQVAHQLDEDTTNRGGEPSSRVPKLPLSLRTSLFATSSPQGKTRESVVIQWKPFCSPAPVLPPAEDTTNTGAGLDMQGDTGDDEERGGNAVAALLQLTALDARDPSVQIWAISRRGDLDDDDGDAGESMSAAVACPPFELVPSRSCCGHAGRVLCVGWNHGSSGDDGLQQESASADRAVDGSSDAALLFTGGEDKTARVWDVNDQPYEHSAKANAGGATGGYMCNIRFNLTQGTKVGNGFEERKGGGSKGGGGSGKGKKRGNKSEQQRAKGQQQQVENIAKSAAMMVFDNNAAAVGGGNNPDFLLSRSEAMAEVDKKIQLLGNGGTDASGSGSNDGGRERIAHLQMWKGDIVEAVDSVSTQPSSKSSVDVRPEWVAMSAMCGMKQWTVMMAGMAEQLEAKNDVHTAACCWLSLGNVHKAVNIYVKHGFFQDALVLAHLRLEETDPIFKTILEQRSEHCGTAVTDIKATAVDGSDTKTTGA
jgi:hypothetical protein